MTRTYTVGGLQSLMVALESVNDVFTAPPVLTIINHNERGKLYELVATTREEK